MLPATTVHRRVPNTNLLKRLFALSFLRFIPGFTEDQSEKPPLKLRRQKDTEGCDDFEAFLGQPEVDVPEDCFPLKTQLDNYLKLPALGEKENALAWWREHEGEFPSIVKAARHVLTTFASSTPAERVFSKLGRLSVKNRARLKPEKSHILTFLASNKNSNQ